MNDTAKELAQALARLANLEAEVRTARPRELLFSHALDLMCVAGVDGYFKELNAAWTDALGWSLEELTASPFIDFVHTEDVEATLDAARKLAGGVTVTVFRNRYRHRNGSYRWLSWNCVFDADARQILGVARDETEVVMTRQALEASEAAYAQLFNGMLDGFSFHDMLFDEQGNPVDYRFRAVNPAFEEMTGLKAADLVGRRVLDILPGTEKHWIDVFGRVVKSGEPIRYENYSQEFDKWFEVLAFRPVEGQFACTFHDITARKRAEAERAALQAQVEHAQKLESLGVMAGGIAHDFNNLLTAIMGGIELAQDDLKNDLEEARRGLAGATQAAQRAAELCRQMLTYAGRAETQKETTDLTALTREILPLAGPSLNKKAQVQTEFSSVPLPVVIDRAQLRQVLLNLILNAGDAIGDVSGVITIRTGTRYFDERELSITRGTNPLAAGQYSWVEVVDTGMGMSRETLTKIFEPFFTTKFAGRGLGLAATLGIVKAHGGGIAVESHPGKGTRFIVVLRPAAHDFDAAVRQAAEGDSWLAHGKILLCDDEAAVRRIAARMVNSLGFDVLEASDGQEALDFFVPRSAEFRAVLLDLSMPRMGGLDVLPELRRCRADIPVVLMSGFGDSMTLANLADAHATFLGKPFGKRELRSALQRVLEADLRS
ncbi:MAG TPA: PAS domain S-box protein [Polyangiaceae bacterium]|nr:PAS domain S-box protein [Polyangiaceae bacterium]